MIGRKDLEHSPDLQRREKKKEADGKKGSSKLPKFGSLRISGKKKAVKQGGVTVTVLDNSAGSNEGDFTRDNVRLSLPSHFRCALSVCLYRDCVYLSLTWFSGILQDHQ